jgi:cysteine synthase
MTLSIDDIRAAAARLKGHIERTPMRPSRTLSEITGAEVWVKFENLQFTAAYKERGALNKLLLLTEAERKRGVIAASAGNHSQGLAFHAARLGIPVTIVMPRGTPFVKVQQTRAFGAEVVIDGDGYDEASAFARRLCEERELVFVHPFNDLDVMAGQGTVALEMLEDVPDLEILPVPIGGGGLISGVATAAKHMQPNIRVVGLEPALEKRKGHVPGDGEVDGHGVKGIEGSPAAGEMIHFHGEDGGLHHHLVHRRRVQVLARVLPEAVAQDEHRIHGGVNVSAPGIKLISERIGDPGPSQSGKEKRRRGVGEAGQEALGMFDHIKRARCALGRKQGRLDPGGRGSGCGGGLGVRAHESGEKHIGRLIHGNRHGMGGLFRRQAEEPASGRSRAGQVDVRPSLAVVGTDTYRRSHAAGDLVGDHLSRQGLGERTVKEFRERQGHAHGAVAGVTEEKVVIEIKGEAQGSVVIDGGEEVGLIATGEEGARPGAGPGPHRGAHRSAQFMAGAGIDGGEHGKNLEPGLLSHPLRDVLVLESAAPFGQGLENGQ